MITGGSQGIGKETALNMAMSGMEGIMISDRNERVGLETMKEVQKAMVNPKGKVMFYKADVTEEEEV